MTLLLIICFLVHVVLIVWYGREVLDLSSGEFYVFLLISQIFAVVTSQLVHRLFNL